MDVVQSFSFEEIPVRTTERNGEAWFCLADVCCVLGISNPSQAKTRLDEDEHDLISNEGQYYGIISESGLYSLVLGSRKPEAKRFKRWVTAEVIPSIRKTGSYSIEPSMPAIPQTYAEALQLAADQAKQLEEQAPKIEVYNRLAERTGDVSTTVVAKQLGTTAIKLNAWLRDKGMKWKNADLPMAGYMDWFNVISDVKNGHEFTQCLVTPKGQIEIAKRWESS